MNKAKKILLAPLDPVHDIGLKIMNRALKEQGYETILLPPDYQPEEILKAALENDVGAILISRTLGYGVAELLSRFIDQAEAAGLRERVKIAIGGMGIRVELAQELGYDAGFGTGTVPEQVIAFIEEREPQLDHSGAVKIKKDLTQGYDYTYKHKHIESLLDQIADKTLAWAADKTSDAITRAALRRQMMEAAPGERQKAKERYIELSDERIRDFYLDGVMPPHTRLLSDQEMADMEKYVTSTKSRMRMKKLQKTEKNPTVFIQYGTGCPFMDVAHIKVGESWGADGVVHFDPSWGARTEGFLEGYLTHGQDGTIISPENLLAIKRSLEPSTIWQVRAHRGLNTPETVLLAGKVGADMTKINVAYGSLGGGTDPARLMVDAIQCMRYAKEFNLPFDVVTNEELCGVPAAKAFAGMLTTAHIGIRLGCRPVLQPLFVYSPEVMITGEMEDNYVDFNAAKIEALRSIIQAPIWPGAPIGFLTQTEDRVQSSLSTALHGALASSLGVEAISIASSDEAYSGGPIAGPSRIDTLTALKEAFRFFGAGAIRPTERAAVMAEKIMAGIIEALEQAAALESFPAALYAGVYGSTAEGAYPGRGGKDTVRLR
ncbi:MAG: cobalamin-dependent protein [Peptococcaceae bacterium]|jgi:methylmalonyl-CoA mutase cobalamin-binding domain/chain|nr:cobalamin-dependent protein [Peptococcaceae bacterium]